MARLDLNIIEAALNTYFIGKGGRNEIWDEIASTNDRAIELAAEGAAEGVLVLARQQSGGRGRQGRTWVSPKDSGIFISFVLRPTIDSVLKPLLSFATGVAAAEAIERVCGISIGLKWVNDLIYDGKKLGGILAEVRGPSRNTEQKGDGWILPPAVIVGVGINLSLPDDCLPPELKGKVESLDNILGKPVNANDLVAEFCTTFEDQYNHLRHSGHELVLEEWKNRSHTLGKRIKAKIGQDEIEGTASDLACNGALIVSLDNGEERVLHAGEISIRLEDGRYA